jgi:triacylglycerol lipase
MAMRFQGSLVKVATLFISIAALISCVTVGEESPLESGGGASLRIVDNALPEIEVGDFERRNDYPVVLVGGFGVWGRDAFLGLKYWGGTVDLQEVLNGEGFAVRTSEVGPVSSYWDRACELYAQVAGTRVDYGIAHSERFGHERYGADYTGRALVPGWGRSPSMVHIVAHSMGGPTARVLACLLEEGAPEEMAAARERGEAASPLFEGGRRWVRSIVSISSPNDGTTLTAKRFPLVGELSGSGVQKFVAGLVAMLGGGSSFYDFKLDQWGLRFEGGDWKEYYKRIMKSPIWESTRDLSAWDGSPEGAAECNARFGTLSDVYYFSFATKATRKSWWSSRQIPLSSMMPLMRLVGFPQHMGSYVCEEPGKVKIDRSWWPNDGIVNTRSMAAPTLGESPESKNWDGVAMPGIWMFMGTFEKVDHAQVIGLSSVRVLAFYRSLMRLLASLE